jgi:hypothetical protein
MMLLCPVLSICLVILPKPCPKSSTSIIINAKRTASFISFWAAIRRVLALVFSNPKDDLSLCYPEFALSGRPIWMRG